MDERLHKNVPLFQEVYNNYVHVWRGNYAVFLWLIDQTEGKCVRDSTRNDSNCSTGLFNSPMIIIRIYCADILITFSALVKYLFFFVIIHLCGIAAPSTTTVEVYNMSFDRPAIILCLSCISALMAIVQGVLVGVIAGIIKCKRTFYQIRIFY